MLVGGVRLAEYRVGLAIPLAPEGKRAWHHQDRDGRGGIPPGLRSRRALRPLMRTPRS